MCPPLRASIVLRRQVVRNCCVPALLVLLAVLNAPAEAETWISMTPPTKRTHHTAVYSPTNDRMIIFGGQDISTARRDVWRLTFSPPVQWNPDTPTIAPIGRRFGHSAILRGGEVFVFGGTGDDTTYQDCWRYNDGGSWTSQATVGTPPSARAEHSAIYDPIRDRMIVFGGALVPFGHQTRCGSCRSNSIWTKLSPMRPAARQKSPCAPSTILGDRMVVYGGLSGSTTR
jgi:hypothetical protein